VHYPQFWRELLIILSRYGEVRFFPYPKNQYYPRFSCHMNRKTVEGAPLHLVREHADRFRPPSWPLRGPSRPRRVPLHGACIWAEDICGAAMRGWKDWSGDTDVAVYRHTDGALMLPEFCATVLLGWAVGSVSLSTVDLERSPQAAEFSWRTFFAHTIPFQHDLKIPRGQPDWTIRLIDDGNCRLTVAQKHNKFWTVAYMTS
jgi:hypothetical protein